ncbi:ribosome silencing factor [Chamaesiphon sp. VAR_48_metabat_135_sub]|uniref:ribosome silencing factor n=1 Tax=Chamaesiphon sp. VAR_48_metabat_135_sub TaxID=2964699 RepID=UPI00286BEBB3|nr:ribosome silencing factor [Chamaesiphon sp. VAR_48_metabat_135_sub]
MTATLTNIQAPEYTIEQLAFLAADAADDRKAGDMVLINIGEVSTLADYLLIVTGFSKVQLRAISDSVADRLEEELDRVPLRTEGHNKGGWILIDYGDLIVHILMPELREFYSLEAFWGHGQIVTLPEMQPKNPVHTVDLYGTTPEADLDEYDLDDSDLEEI